MGKRWRGLRHQIRVTIITTVAATVVLGMVLVLTGFMLTKSITDTARRQMHGVLTARLQRDSNWTIDDIIYTNHRAREREKEQAAGIITAPPPPRRDDDRHDRGSRRGEQHPNRRQPPVTSTPSTPPPHAKGSADPAPGTKPGPGPDPSLRPRLFQALYSIDGKPFPDFMPADLTIDSKPLHWPTTLSEVDKLPYAYLYAIGTDQKGRFKVLCLYDVSEQFAQLSGFKWALLVLWPVLVAIIGLATYLAVGSSFKPLHKLLGQASTLSLNDRMETADQAEFGELASSINSYLDRLEKVVKQQEEFAVDAAHELCTPLTALRGQLELALLQKNDSEAYAEAAHGAIAQVTRLSRLVESLLLATRPRDNAAVTPVDVQQALEEVQARWVDRYAARHVDLQLSAEAFEAAMPEEELESVMENLLANALKFSPANTTVRITLDAKGHLIVQDQGPGIPIADRERVFERFERGTTKARGFGIGLYLVRRLLEQRGGAIAVGDSPSGARIEVALPA